MPVEKISRSSSRQPSPPEGVFRKIEITLEATRLRSCAECRRLKRRCDRQWPCQSCVSRGCASLCPNGTGGRRKPPLMDSASAAAANVLTEEVQLKLKKMSERIKDLEEWSALLWKEKKVAEGGAGGAGGAGHPLLSEELLKIKNIPAHLLVPPSKGESNSLSVASPPSSFGRIRANTVSDFTVTQSMNGSDLDNQPLWPNDGSSSVSSPSSSSSPSMGHQPLGFVPSSQQGSGSHVPPNTPFQMDTGADPNQTQSHHQPQHLSWQWSQPTVPGPYMYQEEPTSGFWDHQSIMPQTLSQLSHSQHPQAMHWSQPPAPSGDYVEFNPVPRISRRMQR